MSSELNKLYLMDCMEGMKQFPDKYFELAIVDPPYGIKKHKAQGLSKTHFKKWVGGEWDNDRPSPEYFEELKRISKNQIIWGANYFIDYLDYGKKWIVWDKMLDQDQSHFELAYTSFVGAERIFRYSRSNLQGFRNPNRFHPTEKPVSLYRWLLQNYTKPGDKILDTHVGSGSSIIACYEEKFEWIGFEIDKDYYEAATNRINEFKEQGKLF